MGSPIPILVLAWNKEEVTQACLASIAEVTSLEHRVVSDRQWLEDSLSRE